MTKKRTKPKAKPFALSPPPAFTKEARWHMRELAYSLLDAGRDEGSTSFPNLVKSASKLHMADRTIVMGSHCEDLMTAAGHLLRAAQLRDLAHRLLDVCEKAYATQDLPWMRKP